LRDAVNEHDALLVVHLGQAHFNNLRVGGLHRAPNKLRLDGHLAMPAVHQHAKLHAPRAPKIKQAVHRGADGAAGIEDIVHQHQVHVVHGKGNVRSLKNGLRRNFGEIVAVKSDVQRPDSHFRPVYPAYPFRDALRQRDPAPANSDQHEIFRAAIALDDLVRQPLERAVNLRGGHDLGFFEDAHRPVILTHCPDAL